MWSVLCLGSYFCRVTLCSAVNSPISYRDDQYDVVPGGQYVALTQDPNTFLQQRVVSGQAHAGIVILVEVHDNIIGILCVVLCCAEGAVTKRQRPGCLPTGKGKRAGLCVLCAHCV